MAIRNKKCNCICCLHKALCIINSNYRFLNRIRQHTDRIRNLYTFFALALIGAVFYYKAHSAHHDNLHSKKIIVNPCATAKAKAARGRLRLPAYR